MSRRPLRIASLAGAVVASAALLYAAFAGAGPLPALGPAFNPVTGAWTMAADAAGGGDQDIRAAGLDHPVRVTLERDGTAHVVAADDHDVFLAIGYLHARFRLFQMDLLRRQGEGRLAEVVGPAALDSDRFELQLGLLRTARTEWAELPAGSDSRMAALAYSQGVNDRITEDESRHRLPALFTFLGYEPAPWTPVDSLVVKGDMTQTLDFTDTPLQMALLDRSLGPAITSAWFPILPPNRQSPYDLGPYPPAVAAAPVPGLRQVSAAEAATAAGLIRLLDSRPGLVARGGDSNNWAVAGPRSAGGGALLAGDPHLHLTLPSIWYQLTADSPGYHAAGVSIPGTPVVLIGHNRHIAWSLTNGQNQATLFYEEKEDTGHPGQYFWRGAWRPYSTVTYSIPVKGGPAERLTVRLSVHGPVITQRGLTTSVWWAGGLPSQDLDVLLRIGRAGDFAGFRDALAGWHAPSQNFVYADDRGNIGLISAGYYPIVASGRPWLPLPGTGESDVTGTIPYAAVPQAYDPPGGILWSANQRQVGPDYPYYIGTASNFFDPGYRANEIHRVLGGPGKIDARQMEALQSDVRDYLAAELAPKLVGALDGGSLNSRERQARDLLAAWDGRMEQGSAAAAIWWTFWQAYMASVFDPWWRARDVKVDRAELADALAQDLEVWTLGDAANPAFTAPGGKTRTAPEVMRAAFATAVASLTERLGGAPAGWAWGRLHTRELESLAQIQGLNYGPRPDRGDTYTPLAADGSPSVEGPSWRMVVDWGAGRAYSVYPGGQSENPASAWYTDRVDRWWAGGYSPMLDAGQASAAPGHSTWTLSP